MHTTHNISIPTIFETADENTAKQIMLANIESIADLYHSKKINDATINNILAGMKIYADKKNKLEIYMQFFAGVMFRINYSDLGEIKFLGILLGGMDPEKPVKIITDKGKFVWKLLSRNDERHSRFVVDLSNHLYNKKLPVPEFIKAKNGNYIIHIQNDNPNLRRMDIKDKYYGLLRFISTGKNISGKKYTLENRRKQGGLAAQVMNAMEDFNSNSIVRADFFEPEKLTEIISPNLEKKFSKQMDYLKFLDNQKRIYLENYKKLGMKNFPRSSLHGDLNPGNILFDENGDIVGLIDPQAWEYYRIVEFLRIALGGSYESMKTTYNKEALKISILEFQSKANKPFSDNEIRGLIEIIRCDFLRLSQYFSNEMFVSQFNQFVDDFSSEQQIASFVREIQTIPVAKKLFMDHYSNLGEIKNMLILNGGFSGYRPVKIETINGKKYVLKLLDSNLDITRYMIAMNNYLFENGILVAKFFQTDKLQNFEIMKGCSRQKENENTEIDKYIVEDNGKYFGLMEFLETAKFVDTKDLTFADLRHKGMLAGQIINVLADFNFTEKPSTGIYFDNGDITERSIEEIWTTINTEKRIKILKGQFKKENIDEELAFARSQVDVLKDRLLPLLPYLKKSHMHADLNHGNTLFDDARNPIGVIDVGGYKFDYRIFAFVRILLSGDVKTMREGYNLDRLKAVIIGFQETAEEPLSDYEIRAVIEALRIEFLDSFAKHSANHFSYPVFKKFIENFSTEAQIIKFIEEVNALAKQQKEFAEYHNPRPIEHFDILIHGRKLNLVRLVVGALNKTLEKIKYSNVQKPIITIRGSTLYLDPLYATDVDFHVEHIGSMESTEEYACTARDTMKEFLEEEMRQFFPENEFIVEALFDRRWERDLSALDMYFKITHKQTGESKNISFNGIFADWRAKTKPKEGLKIKDLSLIMTDYFDTKLEGIDDIQEIRRGLYSQVITKKIYQEKLMNFYVSAYTQAEGFFQVLKGQKVEDFEIQKKMYLLTLLTSGEFAGFNCFVDEMGKVKPEFELFANSEEGQAEIKKSYYRYCQNKILKRICETAQYSGNRDVYTKAFNMLIEKRFDLVQIQQYLFELNPTNISNLKNILFERFWHAETLSVPLFSNKRVQVKKIVDELKASMRNIAVIPEVFFENIQTFYLNIINKEKYELYNFDILKLQSLNFAV
jgi:Ser/Thr protein kinase RdoA (MazF antagonist)